MVIKEITDDLINEAFQLLPLDKQTVAYELHELSNLLNLKIGMRRNVRLNVANAIPYVIT